MNSILKSELDRMIKSKKNRYLFVVSTVIFMALAMWIKIFNVGFYDPEITTTLNSLNTPPFIIREFHLFLLFVFCPMIFIESFNHENTSGAYRMYLLRGSNKTKYILAKLVSCALVTALFMICIYVLGTMFGYFFMDNVQFTTFFNLDKNFTRVGAAIYNLKFYALEYLIVLAFLGVSSIVSIVSKNSVIAYFLSLGICIGSIYISNAFEFFLGSTKTIFDVLSNMNSEFVIICIIMIMVTTLSSILLFSKRDYLN